MYYDLTKGKISKNLILFALSMMAGNLMQQFYNIADTLIVGRVVGKNALAAVGSAYTRNRKESAVSASGTKRYNHVQRGYVCM